jgi:hypothetical protein
MMAPALLSARCCACVGGTAFEGDAVRPAASLTAPLRAGARYAARGRRSLRMIAGAKVWRRATAGAPPWAGTDVARRSEAAAAGFVALGLRMSDAAAAGFVELGLRMPCLGRRRATGTAPGPPPPGADAQRDTWPCPSRRHRRRAL